MKSPKMNESLKLDDLNDDCLREVLSRLPNIDLCAANGTCRRFKEIAYEVAKKRFKNQFYECEPNEDSLKEHATILESFGGFISTMSLRMCPRQGSDGPCMEADEIFPLLDHCPSLIGLYIIGMSVEKYPIGDWCNNVRLLEFIQCTDVDEHRKIASVLSACKRLEVFGYFHENRFRRDWWKFKPAKRLWLASPTIKHLHISDFFYIRLPEQLPTPEDMTKLFTLELKGERGCIDENIFVLALKNPLLVNLVLQIPGLTEDLQSVARYLKMWTNLMSYDIYIGFQMSDETFGLFPNLIYVGRSDCPREHLITHYQYMPQHVYKYKWTRDTGRFQDGSDSHSLFREFRAWKAKMKGLGLLKQFNPKNN